VESPLYEDIVFNFRLLSPEELKRLNFSFKYGSTFTTVITQPKKFMPWLMRQFKEQGGNVECRTIAKLEDLAGSYDIVVNCAALGNQKMLPDPTMYPVKGQLVHVKAPWVKTFIYCEDSTYFIPHNDYIVIGGCRIRGDSSTNINYQIQDQILQRAYDILPQLKGGEIVGNWAGVRPSRDPLRLERQVVTGNGKTLRVVHNYGHGANGVCLAWGTSVQAAKLVKQCVDDLAPPSRL